MLPSLSLRKRAFWIDLLLLLLVAGLLWAVIRVGSGMAAPFSPEHKMEISLDPTNLPYYIFRSLIRMFIALSVSLAFTFVYGKIAARSRATERVMIPIIDILQSVPVLGFLSVTVVAFMRLFPHSLMGMELASIFAIFTGQVWNMTLGFYQSLLSIPRELREAAEIYGLRGMRRFTVLELSYSMVNLIWNSMMSFGGGWFFLAASESITVLNKDIRLPGIGSYIAEAMDRGDTHALYLAVVAMILTIVVVDQLFWRPLVAWSQKFKVEFSQDPSITSSWMLRLIRQSRFIPFLGKLMRKCRGMWHGLRRPRKGHSRMSQGVLHSWAWRFGQVIFLLVMLAGGLYFLILGSHLVGALGGRELLHAFALGFFTMLRVFLAVVLGALWTIPLGTYIGLNPRIARVAQPLVQIAASFPANVLFPLITLTFLQYHISIQWGSVFLMMLGTQWYILFNVIAGASAIPNDLKEVAAIFHIRGWQRFKRLILPAILPSLVTGFVTASGGAWNASIVSELVSWKNNDLVASGLGAYITQATTVGDWSKIVWGIFVMAFFVVCINRFVWHRLYLYATRFQIGD